MPEIVQKTSRYAEKVMRRRAQFGVGPMMSRDGRPMPWPRPIAQPVFIDNQRKPDWREYVRASCPCGCNGRSVDFNARP